MRVSIKALRQGYALMTAVDAFRVFYRIDLINLIDVFDEIDLNGVIDLTDAIDLTDVLKVVALAK